MTKTVRNLLLAATMFLPAHGFAADELGHTFNQALEAYERSHYADSVRLLELAAAGNDARAQEMLGFMYLYGPALYGTAVPRNIDRARHWLQKAAAAGSEPALYVLQRRSAKTAALRNGGGSSPGRN